MKRMLVILVLFSTVIFANPFDASRLDNLKPAYQYSWSEYGLIGKLNHQKNQMVIVKSPDGRLLSIKKGDHLGWENALIKEIMKDRIGLRLPAENSLIEILF